MNRCRIRVYLMLLSSSSPPQLPACCPCCSCCYPFAATFSLLINFNALCHNNDIIIISFLVLLLSALARDCVDLSPFYGQKRKNNNNKKTTTNLRLIYKYFCSPYPSPLLSLFCCSCIFLLNSKTVKSNENSKGARKKCQKINKKSTELKDDCKRRWREQLPAG